MESGESGDTSQGRIQHLKKGGGNPGKSEVYKACTAENVRKIGVKSTVLELQKTYTTKRIRCILSQMLFGSNYKFMNSSNSEFT